MDFKINNKYIDLEKFIKENKKDYEVLCSSKNIKIELNMKLNNHHIFIDDDALMQIRAEDLQLKIVVLGLK